MTYGFPATALYISLALLATYSGIKAFRQAHISELSAFGLLAAAGLAGVLTHNAVESVFTNNDWVNSVYWLLTGLGMISVRKLTAFDNGQVESSNPLAVPSRSERTRATRETIPADFIKYTRAKWDSSRDLNFE